MARNGRFIAWLAFAAGISMLQCAAADRPCGTFTGVYVRGKPSAGEDGLVLEFDPKRSTTGDTLFSGFAEVNTRPDGRYSIFLRHLDGGGRHLEYRRQRRGERPDAVMRLEICPKTVRPVLIRVEIDNGRRIIYLEPLP